jgi:hypothetical protein
VQSDGDDGDVVIRAVEEHPFEELVADLVEVLPGQGFEFSLQPCQAGVEVLVAAFHQPIGVEEDDGVAVEQDLGLASGHAGGDAESRSAGTVAIGRTVPSGLIAIGGGWPALDQRSRVTSRVRSLSVCSRRATTAVAAVPVCSVSMTWSARRRISPGAAPSSAPMVRTMERIWPMAAAAAMSWPMTSPMTRTVAPAGWRKASYQSPPTSAARAAGT